MEGKFWRILVGINRKAQNFGLVRKKVKREMSHAFFALESLNVRREAIRTWRQTKLKKRSTVLRVDL